MNLSTTETSNLNSHGVKRWVKIVLCILYSMIFIFGVLGNATVCFIMHQRKKLRTVTNFFILNLAISDLIFAGSIPLEFPLIIDDYKWPYTSFFCKLYSPVQTIVVSVSIFTLTAVSVIRYRAIIHPLKRQISHVHANYLLFGIWTFSTLLMIPHFVTLKLKGSTCDEEWPHSSYRKIYTTLLCVCFYVVPLIIVVFAYAMIVKELSKEPDYHNIALKNVRNEETKKVVSLLIKITVVFAICNLPAQLMWMWLDFGNADETFPYFWDLLTFLNIFMFANSACNPLLYYIFHDKFRQEVHSFLEKYCRLKTIMKNHGQNKPLCITENEIPEADRSNGVILHSTDLQTCITKV